jgi:hypothetical protein
LRNRKPKGKVIGLGGRRERGGQGCGQEIATAHRSTIA